MQLWRKISIRKEVIYWKAKYANIIDTRTERWNTTDNSVQSNGNH